jgi:hypothetical protein
VSKHLHHHRLDIYDHQLHLATTDKAWKRLCKDIDSLDPEPNAWGYTGSDLDTKTDTFHVSIYIGHEAVKAGGGQLVNTIAHEAAHAASLIHRHIGAKVRGIDEPHAYLVGWIAGWIWDNVGRA